MNIRAESHLATTLPVVVTGINKKREPILEIWSKELGVQASSKHWRQEVKMACQGYPGNHVL